MGVYYLNIIQDLSGIVGIIATSVGAYYAFLNIRKLKQEEKEKRLKETIQEVNKTSRKRKRKVGLGILVLLLGLCGGYYGFLYIYQCSGTEVVITSPKQNERVERFVTVQGHACLPPNHKIALLTHQKKKAADFTVPMWFIHSECAVPTAKGDWRAAQVEVGTDNTREEDFEVYAYAIPDSVCNLLLQIINSSTYSGTTDKPAQFTGVYDVVYIKRK